MIGAIVGGSSDDGGTKESHTVGRTQAPPKPPPTVPLIVKAPTDGDVVHRYSVTVRGVSAPHARVRVSGCGGAAHTKADRKGKWTVVCALDLGENTLTAHASAEGFARDEEPLDVTRRRSAAELAALREKRAQEAAARKANFIASAQTIPYNQLEKNPDRYAGTKVKYTGQIFQIQEDSGSSVILLSVTDQGYGFWDDHVWVDYDGTIQSAEDDIITVYGVVKGQKSYETQIGGETYVPQMRAKYIDE